MSFFSPASDISLSAAASANEPISVSVAHAEREAMDLAQQCGSDYVSVELSRGLRGGMYEAMSNDEAGARQPATEIADSRAIMHESMANYARMLDSDQEAIRQIRDFLDQWEKLPRLVPVQPKDDCN